MGLIWILFAFSSGTPELSWEKGFGGTVTLQSTSREDLQRNVESLRQWKNNLGEGPAPEIRIDKRNFHDGWKADVTGVIPDALKKICAKTPCENGPNCWNTCLAATKIIPGFRYTSGDEMTFWMDSPLCHPVSPPEKPRAGDIIAIRDKWPGWSKLQEVHGYVYLSEDFCFSKTDNTRYSGFEFAKPDWVYGVYPVPKECRGVKEPAPQGCGRYSTIFRCEPLHSSKLQKAFDSKKDRVKTRLDSAECKLSDMAVRGVGVLSRKQIKPISDALAALKSRAEQELKQQGLSEEDTYYWESIRLRADSLQVQIGDFDNQW